MNRRSVGPVAIGQTTAMRPTHHKTSILFNSDRIPVVLPLRCARSFHAFTRSLEALSAAPQLSVLHGLGHRQPGYQSQAISYLQVLGVRSGSHGFDCGLSAEDDHSQTHCFGTSEQCVDEGGDG